jgi:2-succinyl-5-enolpyruvyl-6-hydroxy-3-cyclohexene-1-carboxylate synthase
VNGVLAAGAPLPAAGSPPPACQALSLRWRQQEEAAQKALERQLGDRDPSPVSEAWLARALSRLLPPGLPLMLASSSPVRDWESFAAADAPWRPIHGFRGASGIDGTLSIACGLAEACGQLVLVSGDLALLHDANGWLWARQLRGRLTVVLIDNGGGGIFEQLPIRTQPPERLDFERLFAMPQNIDQLALAALHGVPGRRLRRGSDLADALAWALSQPVALLELRTHRREDAALRQQLRRAVCDAASGSGSGSAGRMAGLDSERR